MELVLEAPSVADIQAVGAALGRHAAGGDLGLLNGPLGAGKTTMTQGIANGLGIDAKVSSPTFVIVQNYHGSGLDLVHVDAYRLGSLEEIDALDLDSSLDVSLTVVEWGAGKAEVLSQNRLEVEIDRPLGAQEGQEPEDLYEDAPRVLKFRPFGERARRWLADIAADCAAYVPRKDV